jgi:3,4-dihydroxy 2-butanone 4-phosphate synthase / GTP cyclohydrolase II
LHLHFGNQIIIMDEFNLHTIPEAIDAIKKGDLIIVVDDEDRENEGDFIAAAELITPEKVNFMATHGRGLICVPLTESRCEDLELDLMVGKNTSSHQTPFTVSVDLIGHGCTTGISASDRAKTIQALADDHTDPEELGRPGHIFPLKAKDRGVLRRSGHTEAAVDLARLAGLKPAGVLVEIMNEDGTMARLPQLMEVAEKFNLKIVSIKDLIAYLLKTESLIDQGEEVEMPTKYGDFRIIPFRQKSNGAEHVALIKGSWEENEEILVRMHSSCMTGDIFGSFRCECGEQLHKSMEMIEKAGKGVVVYMMQEGRGIGLMNKIAAYKLQDEGLDTIDANLHLGFQADERDYGVGAQILRNVGVHKMKLLTNNPVKRVGIEGYGLKVTETIPVEVAPNEHNQRYLKTKRDRMGHFLQRFKYD